MRRSDREITDKNELLEIMNKCEVCRLALNDDGYPYIIPLNFGIEQDGERTELIFHSALEGRKVELIRNDNRATFEMDCEHQLQYVEDKGFCSFAYESIIGRGSITILEDEDKESAIRKIMDHYHPGENAYFNTAAIPRTLVYKLTIEEMTGKRKEIKK